MHRPIFLYRAARRGLAPFLFAAALVSAGSSASVIPLDTHSKALTGSGWRVHFAGGLNVTLDGVTSDHMQVKIEKLAQFTDPFDRGVGPTLEIVFEQISYNAVPYIVIDSESVFNQTGVDWAAFRFNLTEAFSSSNGHVKFDETKTFLDDDPFNIAPFTNYTIESDATELVVADGVVANDSVWIPGSGTGAGELVIYGAPVSSGTRRTFFFKEQPLVTIPEVGTSSLGLLAAGLLKRNRRENSREL